MSIPLVSICIPTFNGEQFIVEAMESAINQSYANLEILVSDDASKDATDTIIEDILKNHPRASWIKYIKHKVNIGMMPNFIFAMKQCHGKYIALCEGDDYWTDPYKLQKQVDFLEANPEYAICFHKIKIHDEPTGLLKDDYITRKVPETTDMRDLAQGNFIHTPSVVFRNGFELPKWFSGCPMGDWPLYCIITGNQKIKKLNENMAVYRMHNSSIWSSAGSIHRVQKTLKVYQSVLAFGIMNKEAEQILQKSIANLQSQLPQKESITKKCKRTLKKWLYG